MDDDTKIRINGIDLSTHIKSMDALFLDGSDCSAFGPRFAGLKQMRPITITGYFDDGRVTCGNCGGRFVPGPEGTAKVTHEPSGISFIACEHCAIAVIAINGESSGG